MEAPQAANSKWAPKETPHNELREVKRPVNNINNMRAENRAPQMALISFFFLPSCVASSEKYVVIFYFPSLSNKKGLSPIAKFFFNTLY